MDLNRKSHVASKRTLTYYSSTLLFIREFLHRIYIDDLFISPFVDITFRADVNGVRFCEGISAV